MFRLAAPPLFGVVIYLLVLMFFDSVEMLGSNFFSREVLFVILMTFVFFELNRAIILILNALSIIKDQFLGRLIIQYAVSIILTGAVISLVLYFYFLKIEGFSTITTELITFNAIYLFATVFYHMYYFSIYYLYKRNDELILTETQRRDSLELELSAYKSQINPDFLFIALEVIISELHANKKNSDELIGHLARVYRYTLDNRQNELVDIEVELRSLEPVLAIFQTKHPGAIIVKQDPVETDGLSIVPGTLHALFEQAVLRNLVNEKMPLTFQVQIAEATMTVSYNLNERIADQHNNSNRIENLKKTYNYLSANGFSMHTLDRKQFYQVPLFKVEEE